MKNKFLPKEVQEQSEFVKWFRFQHKGVLIYATPNGGKRSRWEAMNAKREGMVAGIPDLFIPAWRLYIEFKRREGGVVSKSQKDQIEYLRSVGYTVEVCKGFEHARDFILRFRKDNFNHG